MKIAIPPQNKLSALLISSLLISSCSLYPTRDIETENTSSHEGAKLNGLIDIEMEDEFAVFHTHKRVSDYTSKLAYDLSKNLHKKSLNTPVMMTNFTTFEANSSTSKLGSLISENLIGQLQTQNIQMIDLHLSTPSYNQEISKLLEDKSIEYVLSGVMIREERGVLINARISHFRSQQVISSASVLVPHYISDSYW